jgi:hypothetical protein
MTQENFLLILLLIFIIYISYKFFTFQTKEQKKYEERMKNSLQEQYIIDPETGAKLTLEQAESGIWDENQVEYFTETDYAKILVEEEKNVELAIDVYRKNNHYTKTKFDDSEIEFLENTLTLSKYDEWDYSNCLANENRTKIFFVPSVRIANLNYRESQTMYWVKIQNMNGHYHLYEVNKAEKILLNTTQRNSVFYNNYYCKTLRKSHHDTDLRNLLNKVTELKGFEFEIINDHLFIKSTRLVCKTDIDSAEKLINKVS